MTVQRLAVLVVLAASCDCGSPSRPPAATPSSGGGETEPADVPYRSSYFVFLSDDEGDSLVVPIDVNWHATGGDAVSLEMKAWIGEPGGWAMRYERADRELGEGVPTRWWELPALDGFGFGDDGTTLDVRVGESRISIEVPPFEQDGATRERFAGGTILTRADRTTLTLDGARRQGQLLQERVELPAGAMGEGASPFGRFHYFPLVACDDLYLVKDEGEGRQHATRFRPGGEPPVAELDAFGFAETRRGTDPESAREDIPEAWRIELREWDRTFVLRSTAHHTGHGPEGSGTRAVYRQASVTGSTDDGECAVHGMAELVLEEEASSAATVLALPAMRTSSRPPFVRLRIDNPAARPARLRLGGVTTVADPPEAVDVEHLSVAPAPVGSILPDGDATDAPTDGWIEVPPSSARILEVTLGQHIPWSGFSTRSYRLSFEREQGEPLVVQATLGDGIRHPIRRR